MNSLDKQYQDLLKTILEHGREKKDRTGTGTKSIFGYTIRHSMSDGFPILTTKKVAFKTMATELIWFLRGQTNIKYLVDNGCHIWDGDAYQAYLKWAGNNPLTMEEFIGRIKSDSDFAGVYGNLGPIYGKQWRNWKGADGYDWDYKVSETSIDQIQNLINELKTNPDSRRLMVSAWNPADLPNSVLPPCHYGFQVYTRELSLERRYNLWFNNNYETGMERFFDPNNLPDFDNSYYKPTPKREISLMYNARSQDVPLGTPFNLASYGLLLTIIAKEVNMIPDELIANMGDCHIYLNQIDGVKEQLKREPYSLPQLLGKDEYHYLMDEDISFSEKIEQFKPDFWKLENYQSHPSIKMPLSN
jgi:thymidylate synthase